MNREEMQAKINDLVQAVNELAVELTQQRVQRMAELQREAELSRQEIWDAFYPLHEQMQELLKEIREIRRLRVSRS